MFEIIMALALMGSSVSAGYLVGKEQGSKQGLKACHLEYAKAVYQRQDEFKAKHHYCYDGNEFIMTDSCLELWDKEQKNE